jgi:hypothetical protein
VTFKNIKVNGKMPMSIALVGYDDAHSIEDVKFEGITLDGKPISQNIIQSNAFVKRVVVSP